MLGEPIPQELLPTPDQQRRRRSAKSARTERDDSPQPPLSALQRLSIARKETPKKSSPSIPPHDTATQNLDTTLKVDDGTGTPKPMSKLALLAQKRREEAQQRASPAPHTPIQSSAVSSSPSMGEAGPSKPLSKLAQKMAAARAAKLEESSKPSTPKAVTPTHTPPDIEMEGDLNDDVSSSLFSLPSSTCRPSPFFNLLTSVKRTSRPPDPSSSKSLHLPYVDDEEKLESRVRDAFGPDVESPDDIVLKARGGRAGVAADGNQGSDAPAVKKVQPIKAAVQPKPNVPSNTSATASGETSTQKRKPPRTGSAVSRGGEKTAGSRGISSQAFKGRAETETPQTGVLLGNRPHGSQRKALSASQKAERSSTAVKQSNTPVQPPKRSGEQRSFPNKPEDGETKDTTRPKPKQQPKSRVVQGPP